VLVLLGLATGCLSIDEVQTPNGDLTRGGGADEMTPEATSEGTDRSSACGDRGWTLVRLANRDQLEAWAAPSMAQGCGAAPHRLSATAPALGWALELALSSSTGRVVDATYTTTDLGADGEQWGDYAALIELSVLRFGAATESEQAFELAGTIFGPFGAVPLEAAGCARLRRSPC
jgi:hypothetical protein